MMSHEKLVLRHEPDSDCGVIIYNALWWSYSVIDDNEVISGHIFDSDDHTMDIFETNIFDKIQFQFVPVLYVVVAILCMYCVCVCVCVKMKIKSENKWEETVRVENFNIPQRSLYISVKAQVS